MVGSPLHRRHPCYARYRVARYGESAGPGLPGKGETRQRTRAFRHNHHGAAAGRSMRSSVPVLQQSRQCPVWWIVQHFDDSAAPCRR